MTLPRLSDLLHRTTTRAFLLAVFGIQPLLWCSCDNGCEQVRESFMNVDFVSVSGRTLKKISGYCTSGEQMYTLKAATKFTDLQLDLNPNNTVSTFVFECTYNDYGDSYTLVDTVQVNYTVEPKFLDLSCGCAVMFHIDNIESTHNLISTFEVKNVNITTESGTNIIFQY